MKNALSFIFFMSLNCHAEIMFHKINNGAAKKINIELLNGMHVNQKCIEAQSDCLSVLNKLKKTGDKSIAPYPKLVGNPASNHCQQSGGYSEILHDEKNNEYDYCVFNEKYFVDSWDFYKQKRK